jgi:hypothetical protein
MLFLPESVYRSRRRIAEDLDSGKLTPEQAYRRMLELDPDDALALTELGSLRFEAGHAEEALEYLWRAPILPTGATNSPPRRRSSAGPCRVRENPPKGRYTPCRPHKKSRSSIVERS